MSRRAMSRLLPLWSSRVFSVELNGELVYFSIQEKSRGKEVPRVFRDVQNDDRCYSLLVCSSDRIKRAKFYAELKQKLLRDMPKECELSPMSSFLPNVKGSLLKGYFLKDKSPSASLSKRVLLELIQHDPVLVCSYLRSEDGQQWTQCLWKDPENQTMDMSKDFSIVPSEAPDVHPATLNIINSDVFYNFEEAYGVLKELSGKWYLIAMSSDACWFRAFASAFFLPSASINIMLKDMTGIYDFTTNIQGYGYCINSLNQVAYRNGKIVSVQSGPKSEMEGYTVLPLSGCPDCIIFSRCGPTNTLMLHSRRKNIDAAQLEEFGRRAILLGSSNLHFINNNHDQGNCILLPGLTQNLLTLNSADIIPEATSVLELLPCRAEARRKPDFPVIVIEGLDATGKTTLTESLKNTLGATLLRSPPQCLSPLRACFDREPPLIRRAFYALGNYITAETMGQEGMKTPVIVDRFWHSTAAYAIATAVSGPVCNLPAEGSEVYRWPTDLLQPSLVVLLTLDPEERKRRLRDRGQGETAEEQELDHNQLFRLKVEEAYRRISGPACVTVDASPPADQVLQQVLLLIRGKCHL